MALEHLAGPYPVIDLVTGDEINGANYGVSSVWIDPDGLLCYIGSARYLVQMDGSAYPVALGTGFSYPCLTLLAASPDDPKSGERWYSFHLHGVGGDEPDEHIIDRVFHAPGRLLRSDHPFAAYPNATIHDRWLTAVGSYIMFTATTGGSYVLERAIPGFVDAFNFSWARERGQLWVGGRTGMVVRYDYGAKLESSPVRKVDLAAVAALIYSKKHDVFVSMHSDGTRYVMNVWATTVLPTSISVPVADRTVQAGRAVTLTTRVLGAQSDACEGESVAWSLTGEGALDHAVTATDADGYATNRLVLPLDATGPDATIDVEVLVP